MTLSIIVATGLDRSIGRGGDLAFHISADLKHFKALTMGHPVIMGRKTFQSLPKGALPGRRNIVISRDPSFTAPDIEVFASLPEALDAVASADKAFIIGGGSVYAQAMPLADTIELTLIEAELPDADTFFPEIGPHWVLTRADEPAIDPRTGVTYRFITYTRPSFDPAKA